MLRQIEPETIICYNNPFPEMDGNIIFVDYDLSSWRYMNDDPYVPSTFAKYICGLEPVPRNSDLVIIPITIKNTFCKIRQERIHETLVTQFCKYSKMGLV